MAELKIETEEQAEKAEALRSKLQKESKNPLLDEPECAKLNKSINRLTEVIDAYRKEHPAPAVAEPSPSSSIVLQQASAPEKDPRPDLSQDAHLWSELLLMALDKDKAAGRVYGVDDNTFCGVLNGFRCAGTRLRAGKVAGVGMWILKPDIDSSGRTAWESQADYDDFKSRYLQQYGTEVGELLKELTARHPLPAT